MLLNGLGVEREPKLCEKYQSVGLKRSANALLGAKRYDCKRESKLTGFRILPHDQVRSMICDQKLWNWLH